MVDLMVRISSRTETKYDWFIGAPQECPPLPRVGEHLECAAGTGVVQRIEHTVEEIKRGDSAGSWDTHYTIIIHLA
jgi:hypothetical protein